MAGDARADSGHAISIDRGGRYEQLEDQRRKAAETVTLKDYEVVIVRLPEIPGKKAASFQPCAFNHKPAGSLYS
jgi:hypothetical protein